MPVTPETPVTTAAPDAPVRIRRATADDVPALVRLAAETFPDACPPSTTRAAMDEHIARNLNADVIGGWVSGPGHGVHVAADPDDDARLLGYVMVEHAPAEEPDVRAAVGPDARVGCLSKLYVLAEARGAGVSGLLMDAGLEDLREHGLEHAWLGTSVENGRANAFYARRGFRVVGTRRFDVGGRLEEDSVRLRAL